MAIADFDGQTFLAFIDICGFKELMRTENRAWIVLNKFYNSGYDELLKPDILNKVEGIFVSDCGIIFVRDQQRSHEETLKSLLSVIKNINQTMLGIDCMLTTSISYGPFQYQRRIEFEGIEKNPVFGNAYTSAFLDQEVGVPKIQPGQCRLIKEGLPSGFNPQLNLEPAIIQERRSDNRHYYYYWNLGNQNHISKFEEQFGDSYNLKYLGMLKALKDSVATNNR